ncbi:HMCN1 [Symbiodinium pilosum]|uniref:HMCN1 protein n=1 Tax=Symbiodinium pilosum TaxID=2952 RepID=A0A812Q9R6_SYMPI|nr:HMCN1 [Symbiodinium pilosum]
MSNCRDPVAIVKSRAWNGHLKAHIEWMEARRDVSAQQLVDDFVAANARWINQEAEELLASLEPDLLWKVIDYGSMQFCRDPKAIIKIRIKDAERGKVRAWKHKGNLLWLLHTFRDILPRACEGGKSGKKGSKFSGRTEPKWRSKEKNGRGSSCGHLSLPLQSCPKDTADEKKGSGDEHQRAVEEGRCLFVVGVPPLWSISQIEDFFHYHGNIESVYLREAELIDQLPATGCHRAQHLLKLQKGTNRRSAYVYFDTPEGATNAALVCDRLEVEHREEKHYLCCSIKHKAGSKTYTRRLSQGLRGEVDFKQAQEEARTVFLSKLPGNTSQDQIQELTENHGVVEAIHILPASNYSTIACFVTMESPGEAAFMIRALNNAEAFGTTINASLAVEKNEKRKKLHPEDEWIQWYPLEIRNFPHWTVVDDIKATISTVGPASQRVRIMHYDPAPSLSVARAYFREEADRDEVLKALAGYEFSPGYALMVMALPRTTGTARGTISHHTPQPQPPTFNNAAMTMNRPMMPMLNIPTRPATPILNIPGAGLRVENTSPLPAAFTLGFLPIG